MEAQVTVTGLDHLVLNVADVDRSLKFYVGELGLESTREHEWRAGEVAFPSVRIDPTTIIDLLEAPREAGNVDHICLVVEPTDFNSIADSGRFEVVDGPGPRFGAQGMGTSIYVRDPDSNVVELRYY